MIALRFRRLRAPARFRQRDLDAAPGEIDRQRQPDRSGADDQDRGGDLSVFVSRHRPYFHCALAGGLDHCSLMSAALITPPQRSTSSCRYLAVFSTEPPNGCADSLPRRSTRSGWRSASFTSALILSMMVFDVPGGAASAYQATASKPGKVSAIVGTSARDARRRA